MKTTLEGIVSDIKNEDYHKLDRVSSSWLSKLMRSPAHLRAYLDNPKEPTKFMLFGSGFHALIGEPELFDKMYAKAPAGIDRRTKEGKAAYAEFMAANEGKTILSDEEYQHLYGMLGSILKHPRALSLLSKGTAEQSVFWKDQESGVDCKCRPDFLRHDGIIVDLKTTEDASLCGFQRSVGDYGYHMQSAFYLDGVSQALDEPLNLFVHLVVEKKPPYAVALYTLDDASLERARVDIRKMLTLYSDCKQKNEWPAYSMEIQDANLPAWMW